RRQWGRARFQRSSRTESARRRWPSAPPQATLPGTNVAFDLPTEIHRDYTSLGGVLNGIGSITNRSRWQANLLPRGRASPPDISPSKMVLSSQMWGQPFWAAAALLGGVLLCVQNIRSRAGRRPK